MPLLDFGLPDPQTQGLLAAGFQGLQLSGPSAMPRSLGQIIGGAGSTGLGMFSQAANNAVKNRQAEALIGLETQKTKLTEAQVQALVRQQAMTEDILIREGLLPPRQGGAAIPPAPNQPAPMQPAPMPQGAPPQPSGSLVPTASAPQTPQQGGGLLGDLPPHLRKAAALDAAFNGGKGLPGVVEKSLVSGPWGMAQWNPATQSYETPAGFNAATSEQEIAKAAGQTIDLKLSDSRTISVNKKSYLELQQVAPSIANNPDMISGLMARAPQIIENPRKYASVLRGDGAQYVDTGEKVVQTALSSPAAAGGGRGVGIGQTQAEQVEQKRQESAAQTRGAEDTKYVDELRKKIPALTGSMQRLDRMRERVANGETFDAMGGEVKTTLGNLAISLGIPKENLPKVANSEQYLADLSELIKERLASKDYGSGSGVSNLDILTASQPLPALVKTQQGKLQIIDAMKADMDRSYKDISAARDFYEKNSRSLEGFRFPSEEIASRPSIPKSAGSPAGFPTPNQQALQYLKMNPATKAQFDQMFGPGASERALGR